MRIMNRIALGLFALVLVLPAAGCREDEQGRPLHFEKGVYGGSEDETLTQQDRDALRERAREQNF